MFPSSSPFRAVSCPFPEICAFPHCIFLHESDGNSGRPAIDAESVQTSPKRRRLSEGAGQSQNASSAESSQAPFVGGLRSRSKNESRPQPTHLLSTTQENRPATVKRSPAGDSRSLKRPASPDLGSKDGFATARPQAANTKRAKVEEQVVLVPRKLQSQPSGYGQRSLYLSKLHGFMEALNDQLRVSEVPKEQSLALEGDALVQMALDEEGRIATDSPAVYPNVIKQRLLEYKRMNATDWVSAIEQATKKAAVDDKSSRPTLFNAGRQSDRELKTSHKHCILRRMTADQTGLAAFGYVTTPPAQSDIAKAKEATAKMGGYEQCHRCASRFQVFPDRREDGALTSGGQCVYHWGRPTHIKGAGDSVYACCKGQVGLSKGCSSADSHVFEVKEPSRQAMILAFEHTPINEMTNAYESLAIDCEMSYTVHGNELTRLTALSWPGGEVVIDVLVKPIGAILDLNTRYSGITSDMFIKAKPFNKRGPESEREVAADGSLRIVASPRVARELLFEKIRPETALIGHAIENDLRALRIVHPTIVDTVLLCPHPRGKLPMRRALRDLARAYLGRNIQVGGASGHDSSEDAKATGDVVHELVLNRWEGLRRSGWRVDGDSIVATPSKRDSPGR